MATIYRFRWRGCDVAGLDKAVAPPIVIGFTASLPKAWMDITLDPGFAGSAAEVDLKAAMLAMGWQPFSTDPSTPLRAVTTKQELFSNLSADASSTDAVFTDLLSQAITTDVGELVIQASTSSMTLTTAGYFRILLDGVPIVGAVSGHIVGLGANSIITKMNVGAGAHTVALQWRVDVLGTISIRPVTFPDSEQASMLVREIDS